MKTRFVWSKQASETASGKCHNDMKKSPNFIQNLYKGGFHLYLSELALSNQFYFTMLLN